MIAIGCDHGGYYLKKYLVEYLKKNKLEYRDFGTHSADSCDYPDIALPVANSVADGTCCCGILICGTGIGMSIAANKVPGVRAAVVHDVFSAKATKRHNDANVITCGERVIGPGLFLEIVDAYLNAEFESGRHSARINKIAEIEKSYTGSRGK